MKRYTIAADLYLQETETVAAFHIINEIPRLDLALQQILPNLATTTIETVAIDIGNGWVVTYARQRIKINYKLIESWSIKTIIKEGIHFDDY